MTAHPAIQPTTCAIVLVNLGTPDAPTPAAVTRYLRQFLGDRRVIELPALLWWIILNALVIPLRRKRVAHAYASIWHDNDSPMRHLLRQQADALQARVKHTGVRVVPAMSYGQPSLHKVLDELAGQGLEHLLVLPMFPQYSATSTAAVFDVVARWMLEQRNVPALQWIKDYHDHPLLIAALADSVRRHQATHGVPDRLLMSFHGIPQPYADRGDPYPGRCRRTALLLAQALGLADDQWAISFQSRFGKQEWVKPYTDVLLADWAAQGIGHVQVISPAFSADCLETLEELAVENRDHFLAAGGTVYSYIPALNADARHIDLLQALVAPWLVQALGPSSKAAAGFADQTPNGLW